MKPIFIIHFAPLEWYPPIQNLIVELEKKSPGQVIILTTRSIHPETQRFTLSFGEQVKVNVAGTSGKGVGIFTRYWSYCIFYLNALFLLLKFRPTRVLFFETLSSFPVYIYKRFIHRNASVYIHYHEYTSPHEYRTGMKLQSYFHACEKWLYPRAVWVSHTNEYRMEQFKKDITPVEINHAFILPNYPPRSWGISPGHSGRDPLKVIYVGALGLTTMFTREFAEWVVAQKGKVHWDIYSYNYAPEAKAYIESLNCEFIQFRKAVNYQQLPAVINKYDVGVILYNGHIPNYVFNAPNKLFEYLACGLDVVLPDVMTGSLPYVREDTYPKVMAVDFKRLDRLSLNRLKDRPEMKTENHFFAENALSSLVQRIAGL